MGLFDQQSSNNASPPAYTSTSGLRPYQAPPQPPQPLPNPPAYTATPLRPYQAPPQNPLPFSSGTVLQQINSPPNPVGSTFASLSLHQRDKIRMLQFPASAVDAVRKAITTAWPRGIQARGTYAGSQEFQLYGHPWGSADASESAMEARRLMKAVLEALYNQGWILYASTDCSKKEHDKDTLIFRLQNPVPERCEWMSVCFVKHDHLRLVDAPRELVSSIIGLLGHSVQSHGGPCARGCYDIKLYGYPWHASGEATMATRKLLLILIEGLERFGFTLYASIDQYSRAEGRDADVWHCCRRIGWTPGMPTYHP